MSSSSDTTFNPLSWLVPCAICQKNFHIKNIVKVTKKNKKVVTLTYNNFDKYDISDLKYFVTCNTKKCVTELNDKLSYYDKYISDEDIRAAKTYILYYKRFGGKSHKWLFSACEKDYINSMKKVEFVKNWNLNDWKLNETLKNDYNNDPFKRSIDKKTQQNYKLFKLYCESDEWKEVIRKVDEECDRRMHEKNEKKRKEKEKERKEEERKEKERKEKERKEKEEYKEEYKEVLEKLPYKKENGILLCKTCNTKCSEHTSSSTYSYVDCCHSFSCNCGYSGGGETTYSCENCKWRPCVLNYHFIRSN
jgi:hypothetical protein